MKRMDAFGGIAAFVMKYAHNVRQLTFLWHVFMAFFMGIVAAVYPVENGAISIGDIIMNNYLAWIPVLSMLFLTLTGLDRFVPLFGLPREPEVQLVKDE